MNETKMCASIRSSTWWKTGRTARSCFSPLNLRGSGELNVRVPELGQVLGHHVGSQKAEALAPPDQAPPFAAQTEREALR
ncbi:MAG: hypothetical protein F4145_04745 [Boseongicola sp. SB0675_bin_26]|nr:hypothetical protein [Boseongicola sp. SB0675_bin_26]